MKKAGGSPAMDRHRRSRDDGYRRRLREMQHLFSEGETARQVPTSTIGIVLQQASQDEIAFHLRRLFERDQVPCRVSPWEFACSTRDPLPGHDGESFIGIDLVPMLDLRRHELPLYDSLVYITRPDLLAMKRLYHSFKVLADDLRHKPLSIIMAEACDLQRASLYLDFLRESIRDNLRLRLHWIGTLCSHGSGYGSSKFEIKALADGGGNSREFPQGLLLGEL